MAFETVEQLFGRERDLARRTALVAVVAFLAFWIVDTSFDALVLQKRRWLEELVDPDVHEIWMRLLVAALITVVYMLKYQRARLRLFSSAVAEALDGIQISDLSGRVLYSNRAVQEIYGFSPDELRGKHVSSMNADPEIATRDILPALQQSGRWAGELEVKHKDGRTFPIWLTAALVGDPGGKPMAAVGIIRDITDRKRSEQELRSYAARLERATELKDLFADILRHDLLGPAGALRMSAEVLARRDLPGPTQKLVAQMRRASVRLTDLIEHAAKYAKISALEELDLETLDLAKVLRDAVADVELAHADRSVRVELREQRELHVRANRLVSEVFTNLLSNAVKYGPEGGTITVDVKDGGGEWLVAVADHGDGIPDADKERIFTRFERLHRGGVKGTGLGLAIAKRTVELHRGRIWVEDNPGGGSVFRVALPKAD